MAKKFRALVSNTVLVAFTLAIKDENGKDVQRKATLVCERLEASELRKEVMDGNRPSSEVLRKVTKGWQEQTLVQDEETGQLAEFSPEAFDAMLEVPGVANVAWQSYLREASAKEKN